jgi:hypothetical protein
MQQQDRTSQEYAVPPPAARPSIGIGPQLAITFGTVVVLGIVNGFAERSVTAGLGLSPWVMVIVFALLAAVASHRIESARRGDLYAMWFAAWLAWLLAALYALADVTGVWEGILIWVFAAAMFAWRWVDVRRGRRDSLLGPLRERSA